MGKKHIEELRDTEPLAASEIESLNIEEMSVDQLERRIEMAIAIPLDLGLWCDCNDHDPCTCNGSPSCECFGHCEGYCSDCQGYCASYCEVLSCLDCIQDGPVPV